jgi:hypothetical protein
MKKRCTIVVGRRTTFSGLRLSRLAGASGEGSGAAPLIPPACPCRALPTAPDRFHRRAIRLSACGHPAGVRPDEGIEDHLHDLQQRAGAKVWRVGGRPDIGIGLCLLCRLGGCDPVNAIAFWGRDACPP